MSFELETRKVYAVASTTYQDGSCTALKNKREVEVRGTLMSDGRVRADRIEFDDD